MKNCGKNAQKHTIQTNRMKTKDVNGASSGCSGTNGKEGTLKFVTFRKFPKLNWEYLVCIFAHAGFHGKCCYFKEEPNFKGCKLQLNQKS